MMLSGFLLLSHISTLVLYIMLQSWYREQINSYLDGKGGKVFKKQLIRVQPSRIQSIPCRFSIIREKKTSLWLKNQDPKSPVKLGLISALHQAFKPVCIKPVSCSMIVWLSCSPVIDFATAKTCSPVRN